MKTQNRSVGTLGEDIAARFLEKKGFRIVARNYRKSSGEIDIIAAFPQEKLLFVEVKSVGSPETEWERVSCENRPEERVNETKLEKLRKAVSIFLLEQGRTDEPWDFAVCAVYVDVVSKRAKVSLLKEAL